MRDFFAENVVDWKIIDKFEKEGTISGYCMALAECDKLLNFLLEQEGYGGVRTADKLKKALDRFANPEDLFRAIEIKANVFEKYEQAISIQELKDAIRIYRECVNDFVQGQVKESTTWERFISYLQFNYLSRPNFSANFLLGFLSLIILVLVLDSTHFGQSFIRGLANIFKTILPIIIIIAIILGIFLVLTILVLLYSGKQKGSLREQIKKIQQGIVDKSSKFKAQKSLRSYSGQAKSKEDLKK
ncbi:MAG: hypothetical protein ABH837_01635 [bacterium]